LYLSFGRLAQLLSICLLAGCAGASLGRISLPSLPATQGSQAIPIRLSVESSLPRDHGVFVSAGYRDGVQTVRSAPNPDINPAGFMGTIETGFRDAFQARGFPLANDGRQLTIALVDVEQCTAVFFGGVTVFTGPGLFIAAPNNQTISSARAAFVATIRNSGGAEVFSRRYTLGDTFTGLGALPDNHLVRVLRNAMVAITGDVELIAALRDNNTGSGSRTPPDLTIGPVESACN